MTIWKLKALEKSIDGYESFGIYLTSNLTYGIT